MTWLRDNNTHLNKKPTVSNPVEAVVIRHSGSELPELYSTGERRECLVTTTFSEYAHIGKYNECTGKWMLAWEKEIPTEKLMITEWVYIDEVFAL
jgi:hypothetical protein